MFSYPSLPIIPSLWPEKGWTLYTRETRKSYTHKLISQRKEMFTCLLPRMLRPGFTQIPLNIMLVYPRLSSPASWVLLLSPSLWDISCVLYNNPSNCSLLSTPILTPTGTMFTSAILHRPLFWALFVSQTEHIFLEEAVCTFYRVSM